MNKQNEQHADRDQRQRTQDEHRQQQAPLRLNPRLVFVNPDTFFNDLVMEQQEQM